MIGQNVISLKRDGKGPEMSPETTDNEQTLWNIRARIIKSQPRRMYNFIHFRYLTQLSDGENDFDYTFVQS